MKLPTLLITIALATGLTGITQADTLINLERERAQLLKTLLTDNLTPEQREQRAILSRSTLRDLERMVIRDDRLLENPTPTVQQAFRNYDLTFLVHAAAESGRSEADQWMQELGLTTDSVLQTRLGRR